ncbi:RimK family alpha-L-glutamate ligase [Agromyces sp. NPDC056965]|uniref:ATP-grasp domain-containing protein n=1 Tax=Agromyces sp. NPDC056965 TaxID=3345983 RepID=UPI00363920A6
MTGIDPAPEARQLRVAVLRCERLPRFVTWEIPDVESLFDDDHRLVDALAERGVSAEPVAWSAAQVDWSAYDAVVLRSTWDYVDHLPQFLEVIAAVERSGAQLLNSERPVRWNSDKRYLDDLDRLGVPIVPLVRGTPASGARLGAEVAAAGWDELVLKPAVGVGGAGVVRTTAATLGHALDTLPPATEVMVQPFAAEILDEGELSFIFIGGALSHTLRKRPATGDFRAHGIYGGTVETIAVDQSDATTVQSMLARLPFELLYARVDVVRFEGRLSVLELELIEPMLYLGLAPGSAARFADATIAWLEQARRD